MARVRRRRDHELGAHGVDQIQWALGMDGTGPVEMRPLGPGAGGQLGVEMRYANGVPVRFVLEKAPMGGGVFICEKGKLEINRNKFASNPKSIVADLLKKIDAAERKRMSRDEIALWQAPGHLQNWLDCIKTRRRPVADVEIGHRSITVATLSTFADKRRENSSGTRKRSFSSATSKRTSFLLGRGARGTSCRCERTGHFTIRRR